MTDIAVYFESSDTPNAKYVVDPSVIVDAIALVGSLIAGAAGVIPALSSFANVIRGIKKKVDKSDIYKAEGLGFYTVCLVTSSIKTINDCAPAYPITEKTTAELGALFAESLRNESLTISPRHLRRPAINPAFVRYRERLAALLSRVPDHEFHEDQVQVFRRKLATTFGDEVARILDSPELGPSFTAFKEFLDNCTDSEYSKRSEFWSAYEAHLNNLVFKNLFLHELEGHPDVSLKDVYVRSRATYTAIPPSEDGLENTESPEAREVYAFDLYDHLMRNFLKKNVSQAGNSRLVTGDPGTGKSTFSLMLAHELLSRGQRVLYIPANSIRSFGESLSDIIDRHLKLVLSGEAVPSFEAEISDPDFLDEPVLIILDGLDEYDVGETTVSLAAASLVDHAQRSIDDWQSHGKDVRLLLCGRPEAAASLTASFRKKFHHLHVTGFVTEALPKEWFANKQAMEIYQKDQRIEWWETWFSKCGLPKTGLPDPIAKSTDEGVAEITAQPLLNYMIAVLRLYEGDKIDSLSGLYSDLFERYFERQSDGKFAAFKKVCPDLARFRRIMSEIGLAAWHAGDRSVGTEDLEARFNRPPLKKWLEDSGQAQRGLSAILSAFYTRPEEAAAPEKGLAQRYVFTHKSFREYLTAVAIVRFLRELSCKLDPESEDGWSDEVAFERWMDVFGPTSIDQRQWDFIEDQLRAELDEPSSKAALSALIYILNLAVRRRVPLPKVKTMSAAIRYAGNSEEAIVLMLNALLNANPKLLSCGIRFSWRDDGRSKYNQFELFELLHRIRSRPGCPDSMIMAHMQGLFMLSDRSLGEQISSKFANPTGRFGRGYVVAIDLTGIFLADADLSDARLSFARLHRATLRNCDFSNTSMDGIDLSHAEIGECTFEDARVHNANLYATHFVDSNDKDYVENDETTQDNPRLTYFKNRGARV